MMGKSASSEFLSKLTYIAYTHDTRIKQVDTVRAYSISENYIVELDIVLPSRMVLRYHSFLFLDLAPKFMWQRWGSWVLLKSFCFVSWIPSIDILFREAHDIGEGLQNKLEQLPEVERAFVHLDYEYTHRAHEEHQARH